MDKDKIIIVTYVGTHCYDNGTALDCLHSISSCFHGLFDDTVKTFIIPRRDSEETWVECINPQLVSEEKYKEAEEVLEKMKKALEDLNNENV